MTSSAYGSDCALLRAPALGIVVDSVGSNFRKQKFSFLIPIVISSLTLTPVVGRFNVNYALMPRPTTFRVVDRTRKLLYHLSPSAKMRDSISTPHATGGCPAVTTTTAARSPLASRPLPRTSHRLLLGSRYPRFLRGPLATRSHTRRSKAPYGGRAFGLSPPCPAQRAVTSLRLFPGLRPPAPCVPRHVRCPSEASLPTPAPSWARLGLRTPLPPHMPLIEATTICGSLQRTPHQSAVSRTNRLAEAPSPPLGMVPLGGRQSLDFSPA